MVEGLKDYPGILIDGASGYVGSHLATKLSKIGQPIRCLVRPQAARADVDYLRSVGAQVVEGNLDDAGPEVGRLFSGCETVVHLIGSIAPRRGESLNELHAEKTKTLIERCKRHNVEKVVMVTALGTGPNAPSQYHSSKWQAEELLSSSGLAYVILRPSLIIGHVYGLRDSKLVKRYTELILSRKMVPLINGGINRIQPIFIMDLVDVLTSCLQSNSRFEGTFELGGPDVVVMREFVQELMTVLGVSKPIVGLPPFLAQAIVWLCESVQDVPLLSRDQVIISSESNICQENALVSVFGITPTPMTDALKTYKASRSINPHPEVGMA